MTGEGRSCRRQVAARGDLIDVWVRLRGAVGVGAGAADPDAVHGARTVPTVPPIVSAPRRAPLAHAPLASSAARGDFGGVENRQHNVKRRCQSRSARANRGGGEMAEVVDVSDLGRLSAFIARGGGGFAVSARL